MCTAAIDALLSERSNPGAIAGIVAGGVSLILFLELLLFAPQQLLTRIRIKFKLKRSSSRVAADEERPHTSSTRAGTTVGGLSGAGGSRRRAIDRRFRGRMVIIVITFAVGIGLIVVTTFAGSADTALLSSRFFKLLQVKTVLMELLPPYLFLDDPYTAMLILAYGAPLNSTRMAALTSRVGGGFEIFAARMDYWCGLDTAFKTSLCEKVRRPAIRLKTSYHNDFSTLALAGNGTGAAQILEEALEPLYKEHEVQVVDLSVGLLSDLSAKTSNLYYERSLTVVISTVAAAAAALVGAFGAWVVAHRHDADEMTALLDFPSIIRSEAKRHTLSRLQASVVHADPFFFQPRSHALTAALLLSLTCVCIISPISYIPNIEALAPLRYPPPPNLSDDVPSAQCARRTALVSRAAFFIRELFVNDGATLLSAQAVGIKLANTVDEIAAVHKAIKRGGAYGISMGVISLDKSQTDLLFEPSCLNEDCGSSSVNPPATNNGLEALLDAFLNAIRRVSAMPPPLTVAGHDIKHHISAKNLSQQHFSYSL